MAKQTFFYFVVSLWQLFGAWRLVDGRPQILSIITTETTVYRAYYNGHKNKGLLQKSAHPLICPLEQHTMKNKRKCWFHYLMPFWLTFYFDNRHWKIAQNRKDIAQYTFLSATMPQLNEVALTHSPPRMTFVHHDILQPQQQILLHSNTSDIPFAKADFWSSY